MLSSQLNLPRVIGICGKSGHGKDTIGKYLIEKHGYTRVAFADHLKNICKLAFDLSHEQLHGNKKEDRDERWGVTPREILQFVGTEFFRSLLPQLMPSIGENYFLLVVKSKIEEILANGGRVVITDTRFLNEVKLSFSGATMWCVTRPKLDNKLVNKQHSSEQIDGLVTDLVIVNDSTIAELYETVEHELTGSV